MPLGLLTQWREDDLHARLEEKPLYVLIQNGAEYIQQPEEIRTGF
jgi:hypothetical protein